MKRVNQHQLYELGWIVHPLGTVEQGLNLAQSVWDLNRARVWIEFILGGSSSFALVVCRDEAEELVSAIDNVVPRNTSEFSKIDPKRELNYWEAYRIRNSVTEFEIVFAAELATLDTYIVSKKGIYSTADLVERAHLAFDENARTQLSSEVLSDFRQAGKCLAFELATAAGFHTMRAVEAVVRNYWRLVKSPPTGTKAPDLAVCINELRAARESEKLMDILDHVRDLHRNTIMHPEVFLELKDALRLFDVAKSAISAMAERVSEIKEGKAAEEATAAEMEAAAKSAEEEAAAKEAAAKAAPESAEGEKVATSLRAETIINLGDHAPAVKADTPNGDGTA